jgi:hypothetical protein
MATILEQLDAATHDYFMIQGGKAADNYYETSFLLNYLLKQKKGRFETFSGGKKISVPLRYDGNTAGFFVRGGTLDSTKREAITNVNFARKFAYGNATIFWVDELANAGEAQIIEENKRADSFDKKSEMWHVGHIPASLGLKWLAEEGIDMWNPHHMDAVKRKLMCSDYRYLVPGMQRIIL